MPDFMNMLGKEVTVTANGMQYSGVLIEVSDTEVHLKGLLQWIALPASQVNAIALKEAPGVDAGAEKEEPVGAP